MALRDYQVTSFEWMVGNYRRRHNVILGEAQHYPRQYGHVVQCDTTQYGHFAKEKARYHPHQYAHVAQYETTQCGNFTEVVTEVASRYQPRQYGQVTEQSGTKVWYFDQYPLCFTQGLARR